MQKNGRPREVRGRPTFLFSAGCRGYLAECRDYLLGHSQPFAQSLQHAQSQLQFGQSLQQSFEQQEPLSQQLALVPVVEEPANPPATIVAATIRLPKKFVNMERFPFG
jgi:hypothetical protein